VIQSIKSLKLIEGQLKSSFIEVEILEKSEGCTAKAVPNQLQQVVLNILLNARDAILSSREKNESLKQKKGIIKISISCDEKQNSIIISDNGGGIHLDDINRIFEPYFTTKHPSTGTGIGLYMTKTIIERQMKGEISVHNDSKGAVFTIILPKTDSMDKPSV